MEWTISTNRVISVVPVFLYDLNKIRFEGFDFSPIPNPAHGWDLGTYMTAFSNSPFDADFEQIGVELMR